MSRSVCLSLALIKVYHGDLVVQFPPMLFLWLYNAFTIAYHGLPCFLNCFTIPLCASLQCLPMLPCPFTVLYHLLLCFYCGKLSQGVGQVPMGATL